MLKRRKKTERAVSELAKAQEKAEQRLQRLEETVQELAEAQKETEQRLQKLEETVQSLAEAQKNTERRLNELAEAQKKTEQRLQRLEGTVQSLAEAQKKTEEELRQLGAEVRKLAAEHRKTREQLGGLAHTVGYMLEDKAYEALLHLLKRDYGIDVKELKRDFVEISPNKYEEINILGYGDRNGAKVWIIGECKAQLKKRDVDNFLKKLSRIEHLFPGEKLLIVVTYQTSPQIKRYIDEKGLKIYYSYELGRFLV